MVRIVIMKLFIYSEMRATGTLALWLVHLQLALAVRLPSSYDVSWTSQSAHSAGSMPLGGGDIGLNAWAENGNPSVFAF